MLGSRQEAGGRFQPQEAEGRVKLCHRQRGRAGTGRRRLAKAPGGPETREHLPAGRGAASADPADARGGAQGAGTLMGTDAG